MIEMLGVAVDGWARPDGSSDYAEMRLVVGCYDEAVTVSCESWYGVGCLE